MYVVKPNAITLPETQQGGAQFIGNFRAWGLFSILLIAWIPAMAGRSVVPDAANLYHAAHLGTPYFVPGQFLVLYIAAPSAVLSAIIMVLSPGLILALAFNSGRNVAQWMLHGMLLSIVAVSVLTAAAQSLLRKPLTGNSFVAILLLLSVCSFVLLLLRMKHQTTLYWPIADGRESLTLLSMLVVPAALLITLAPKFYWENFSGDGAHTFESARLLLFEPLPFWPASGGEIASWPGMNTMLFLFPASWFIRFFGEIEVAVRLPYLLFLVGLFAGILAVASHDRIAPFRFPEKMLLWLALLIYTVVMVFNASTSPYLSDVSLPTAQDTLTIALFLGFVLAFVQRSLPWLLMFGLATHLSLPGGLLMMGAWLGAVAWVVRPRPWPWLWKGVAVLTFSTLLGVLTPGLLGLLEANGPGQEHGSVGLLRHLAFLQYSDVRRVGFVIFASGLLPFLALFAWRKQDFLARALTVTSGCYFAFFYFQAHVSLHYFAPVMLLPLVVFWRVYPSRARDSSRRRMVLATFLAGFLSLLISLPTNWDIYTEGKRIGATIENRLPGYEVCSPAVFKASEILTSLFPYTWDPEVPEIEYGDSPLVWNYYSYNRDASDSGINYVVQGTKDPPPDGMILIDTKDDIALYMASEELWQEHRSTQPSARIDHPLYSIDRGIMFRSVPMVDGPRVINVIEVLRKIGIDVDSLLKRLGVKT